MLSSDITKHRHGWLCPDGKFYACEREGHYDVLDNLGKHWTEVEKLNWCKIGSDLTGRTIFFLRSGDPTQAQLTKVHDYCDAHGVELPWWAQPKAIKS